VSCLRVRTGKSLRNFLQQQVTDGVTERIVNVLKTVEINEKQRKSLILPPSGGQPLRQSIEEESSIRERGQRVIVG
jgi:hypothetical protein